MKLFRAQRSLASLCCSLFLATSPYAQDQPATTANHPSIAQLEKDIPDLMHQADVPGVAIAILRHGKPYWQHNFGVKNTKTNEPVADDTIFEAASLSKPVFAYAVLKLVDQGKLGLDVPLSSYLPKPYIDGRGSGSVPANPEMRGSGFVLANPELMKDPLLDKITARIVLSHRTGFRNWRNDEPLKIYFTPGERFSYSGEGYVYLQTIVEQITGKPLNDVMTALVFTPLGMTSSSYAWRSDFDARTAYGHDADSISGNLRKDDHANAAASLNTTAHDYALFLAAVLNGTDL
jgi:CubicO group peptidase (beta-lactamase class C family)